jgi:arabinofuranosyltransferase
MPTAFSFSHLVQRAAPWVFACLLLHHAVHYAWIAEDAFINFRVIANVLDGFGPTWNPGERVQVYTSPLWMGLSVALTALLGDPIQGTVWLSFGLFTLALLMLWQASGRHTLLWLATAALWCSSRSVRDYMCSGLETPLVMAAVGAAVTLPARWPRLSVRALGTLLALCLLVRHDLALLLGPLLVHTAWRRQAELTPTASRVATTLRLSRDLLIGAWPLLAWSAWAWLYYGSPLPNTALAKIVQGWDGPQQAWYYHGFMQHFDPLLLSLMLCSLFAAWACRGPLLWPTLAGLALFTVYLARIGGDYMAGRFMVGPLTLCMFVLAHTLLGVARSWPKLHELAGPLSSALQRAGSAGVLATLLAFGTATWFPEDLWNLLEPAALLHDVADARQSLQGVTDLHTLSTQGVPPTHPFRRNGEAITAAMHHQAGAEAGVFVTCAIGMTGYFAPRQARIIDPLALADRFLAGLPVVSAHPPHIGHFERPVPRDYLASLLSQRNQFTDPWMAAYYDDVQRVLHAPLLDEARLAAIWRLSTGTYHAQLARWHDNDGGGALTLNPQSRDERSRGCLGVLTTVSQARLAHDQLTLTTLALPAR